MLAAEARTPAELDAMVEQRTAGFPLEHVLGWAEFCGLRIAIGPGIFVPRRRTEVLAQHAAALARKAGSPAVVVDLCCGSGAVSAALLASVDQLELHAADIDPVAVRCARRNINVPVYEGDLYEPLPVTLRGHVDVVVANAPYVPTEAIDLLPPEARDHEPRVALDGGADGLDVLRRVTAEARRWLAPGGHLLVETSANQAPQVLETFAAGGLAPWVTADDDATVAIGRRL